LFLHAPIVAKKLRESLGGEGG